MRDIQPHISFSHLRKTNFIVKKPQAFHSKNKLVLHSVKKSVLTNLLQSESSARNFKSFSIQQRGYSIVLLYQSFIWDKVFKSGLSKFCGRQPLKNLLSPLLNTLSHLIIDHCIKGGRSRSYSGLYFLAFELDRERYRVKNFKRKIYEEGRPNVVSHMIVCAISV